MPTEITVPDIGDFDAVEVIEVLVSAGQTVAAEDPLVTLESDKATMDIPAPCAGVITELRVAVGEMVAQGTPVAVLAEGAGPADAGAAPAEDTTDAGAAPAEDTAAPSPQPSQPPAQPESPAAESLPTADAASTPAPSAAAPSPQPSPEKSSADSHRPPPTLPPPVERAGVAPPHASPGVRRFARELGAPLAQIHGSGGKGRIVEDDVKSWVRESLGGAPGAPGAPGPGPAGGGIPPIPEVDFSQFGAVELQKLSRIAKLSGPHLQRAWLNIPHVTHHEDADITDLEAFRRSLKGEAEKAGVRVTVLGFAVKILARALAEFPAFNASLHPDGAHLIVKKYCNIGIAVDTPHGLVVPVIRDAERKRLFELAAEMAELSERARAGRLKAEEMRGGCMTISSIGGIGGAAFTPIVNAPEVAILGITRARMTPVWDGEKFQPRLMLPLDLSYDHRAIDGAAAARFAAYLARAFADVRRLFL
ncbi:MAG: 2-oxo acid dehydrogenase subunit E2 [Gammaproteobacteria bacterium]|nr:2-oxo acid dehydrogenase subunit E2 [Gammaproteobacteria bacterium]